MLRHSHLRKGAVRSCVAAAVILVAWGPLAANDESSSKESAEDLPRFYETAVVKARPLEEATQAATVLDRDEIEALNVPTVAELMRFVPGVHVVSSGPRGGAAFAQIQGGDPNFTVVLLDGVPLNDATNQLGGAVNLNSISSRQVERIEVVRGPTSSFYGSAALSGVVNIITRRGSSDQPQAQVEVTGGGDRFVQTAASVSQGDDEQNFFVGATWERAEDQIVDDEFEQFAVQGNYERKLSERTGLRINGRVTSWNAKDLPEASGGVLGTGETRTSEHEDVSLGFDLLLGAPERSQKIYAVAYRQDLQRASPAIPNVSDPFSSIPASTEETSYLNTRAGWNYPAIARKRTRLNAGVEAVFENGKSDSILDVGVPLSTSYSLDRVTVSALVDFLAERGQFLFEVGARLDKPENTNAELSPNLGLIYHFENKRTRLRVSLGRAFKLASFFAVANPLVGDPGLDPETSVGGSVGVEHSFRSAGVDTMFSVFSYRFDDLIDFDPNVFRLVNRDKVTSRGAEVTVGWKPAERIAVKVNMTYQDVEDEDTGETLVHRPEWSGGARFDWRITDRVRWEVDGQFVTETRDVQISVPFRDTVPGYELLGTALFVRLSPSWLIDARVNNLLDEEYETLIGFPGLERQFLLGVRFQTP